MRYIKKGFEPASLVSIKNIKSKYFSASYETLPHDVIIDIIQSLLIDQGWLCCYCMNEITPQSSRLVHFHPFEEEALNYSNMYLACNDSIDFPPKQQHCYIKKGNEIMPKYMADKRCGDYFRYNTLGEILPAGDYRTIRKCHDNFSRLTPVQQTVLGTIDLLNLNTERLKDLRKTILSQIAIRFRGMGKGQIKQTIEKINTKDRNGRYMRFCEVIIFYLKSL